MLGLTTLLVLGACLPLLLQSHALAGVYDQSESPKKTSSADFVGRSSVGPPPEDWLGQNARGTSEAKAIRLMRGAAEGGLQSQNGRSPEAAAQVPEGAQVGEVHPESRPEDTTGRPTAAATASPTKTSTSSDVAATAAPSSTTAASLAPVSSPTTSPTLAQRDPSSVQSKTIKGFEPGEVRPEEPKVRTLNKESTTAEEPAGLAPGKAHPGVVAGYAEVEELGPRKPDSASTSLKNGQSKVALSSTTRESSRQEKESSKREIGEARPESMTEQLEVKRSQRSVAQADAVNDATSVQTGTSKASSSSGSSSSEATQESSQASTSTSQSAAPAPTQDHLEDLGKADVGEVRLERGS